MILQIETNERRHYIDGYDKINVHHNKYSSLSEIKDKMGGYTFYGDETKDTVKNSFRVISCYSSRDNKNETIVSNCIIYLLNNEGKTISRYGSNTLI